MRPANISKQRILGQVKKLQQEKLPYLCAAPLDDDLYNWHFTFQGPQNTQFHEGIYHGQILLPYEYPFKPPDIVFLNKNGRFQTNTKICLTITQYHPEEWNSAWTIRTMLEAVISLFAQNVQGVGSLTSSSDIRTFLAKNSHSFVCEKCGPISLKLPPRLPRVIQPSIALKPLQNPNNENSELKLKRNFTQAHKIQEPSSSLFNNANSKQEVKKQIIINPTLNISDQSRKSPNKIFAPRRQTNVQKQQLKKSSPTLIYQNRLPLNVYNSILSKKIKTIEKNINLLNHVCSSVTWIE